MIRRDVTKWLKTLLCRHHDWRYTYQRTSEGTPIYRCVKCDRHKAVLILGGDDQ